jgi:dimeric dUTPase (all-alpha-NTP-PPase superfamily)
VNQLEIMLTLQQKLNDSTNGEGWENGVTKQGKKIDWRRCIYLEAAELVESYPWKHWKNIGAKVDRANVEVELVDIWHFVMSEVLRVNRLNDNLPIAELAIRLEDAVGTIDAQKIEDDYYAEIEAIEALMIKLFCHFELVDFTKSYFELCRKLGLSSQRLYTLYIGKNILNIFRQDNGYKDGSYKKIWNGKEDNVVMQEILEENPEISAEELYKKLQECYKGTSNSR